MQLIAGKPAKKMCGEIIDDCVVDGDSTLYPPPYCAGFFKDEDSGKWVAFDNTTADCWVEDFDDVNFAILWCEGKIEAEGI